MKNRKTLLHICHVPTQNTTRPFISQKNMDITKEQLLDLNAKLNKIKKKKK